MDFSKVKTILINYVFNIIEDPSERINILNNLVEKSQQGTVFIVAVRSAVEINHLAKKGKWITYNDGYLTSSKTFQHGYFAFEFRAFLMKSLTILDLIDKKKAGLLAVCTKN